MISFKCQQIRTLYLIILLIQINICYKRVFCEPKRQSYSRHPSYDRQYYSYSRPKNSHYYDNDYHLSDRNVQNYLQLIELTDEEIEENEALLSGLTKPPIYPRGSSGCDKKCTSCLSSCNYLKNAKQATTSALVQYLYLTICAKGCKDMISCLNDRYCLPVMQENPDFFVQCVNSCPLFPIIPKVFLR